MLDLSVLKDKTYDIKLENGEMLHIKKPTQRLMKYVTEIHRLNVTDGLTEEDKVDKIFEFVVTIFNHNTDDKKFKKPQIEDMFDISIASYIVQDYLNFTTKILSDPNS